MHRSNKGKTRQPGPDPAGVPFIADYATGTTRELQGWFYRVKMRAIADGVPLPREFRLYWFRSHYATEAQRRGLNRTFLAKGMGTSEVMLERHYTDTSAEDILSVGRGMQRKS